MKIRTLAALLPLVAVAACSDSNPLSAPAAAVRDEAGPFSYDVPVREGNLTGADGVRLFYRVVGTGPDTVVVLHGGPGLSMSYLSADLAPLAHGRTIIYYDQRGGGFSQTGFDPAGLALDRHLADLEAVRAHFGLEKMTLVGHSWGALLAGFYAREHADRLEKLVLLNPAPINAAQWGEFEANIVARADAATNARLNELVTMWFTGQGSRAVCDEFLRLRFATYFANPANMANLRGAWCDVPEATAAGLLPTHLTILGSLGAWDLSAQLGHVRVPTLVVHGEADVVPFATSQGFAAAIPGAELRVLPGVGHFPWMENPVPFFTAVNTFLRRENL